MCSADDRETGSRKRGRCAGAPATSRSRAPIVIIVLACMLAGGQVLAQPTSDGPWYHVTVTDGQGWIMRDVTLSLTEDAAAVVMTRADGAQKELAFADLLEVLDADGRDITEEVRTGIPSEAVAEVPVVPESADLTPEFAPLSVGRNAAGRGADLASPPLFGFAVDVGGGVAGAAGDWFWGLDDGAFVQGGLRVGLSGRRDLHVVFRNQSLGNSSYAIYGEAPVDIAWSMQSFQLLLGHHTAPRVAGGATTAGYLEGGGGVMRIAADAGSDSDSMTRFGFALQMGLWILTRSELAFDVGLHAFYKPGWLVDDEAGGTSLGLHVAAMYVR